MTDRLAAECWPIPEFIEEELEARGVKLAPFLKLTGISTERWALLKTGEKGALLSECEKIAGALHINVQFIANLNHSYLQWKRSKAKEKP